MVGAGDGRLPDGVAYPDSPVPLRLRLRQTHPPGGGGGEVVAGALVYGALPAPFAVSGSVPAASLGGVGEVPGDDLTLPGQ